MQASILPPPVPLSLQNSFTSAAQALAVTALSTFVWQPSERSLRCVLRQSLIRPPPGWTPAHCAFTSFKQAPVTSADAMGHASNMAMTKRELVMGMRVVMESSCLRPAFHCYEVQGV